MFTSTAGESSYTPIQITKKNNSIYNSKRKEKDLDVVDKVIKEIDIRTKQVLIEAFIVEANSDFEKALGTRLVVIIKELVKLLVDYQVEALEVL